MDRGIFVVGLAVVIVGILFVVLFWRDAAYLLPFNLSWAVIFVLIGVCIAAYGGMKRTRVPKATPHKEEP